MKHLIRRRGRGEILADKNAFGANLQVFAKGIARLRLKNMEHRCAGARFGSSGDPEASSKCEASTFDAICTSRSPGAQLVADLAGGSREGRVEREVAEVYVERAHSFSREVRHCAELMEIYVSAVTVPICGGRRLPDRWNGGSPVGAHSTIEPCRNSENIE